MRKHIILFPLILLTACLTTTHEPVQTQEDKVKTEQEKEIQRDMRHNMCVSRGHAVGSLRYKHCMKVKY